MKAIAMTCCVLTAAGVIAATTLIPRNAAAQDAVSPIRFLWSFCAQTGPEANPTTTPITKDTTLRSGDRIKMFLQPLSPCYIYILYYSSQKELAVLFPFNPAIREKPGSDHYLIPDGARWFTLDNHIGAESFYLIASVERLDHLEKLIRLHLDPQNRPDATASAQNIIAELDNLRRRNLKLAIAAERPVRLGGNIRGDDEARLPQDIRRFAVEISARDFYSRTFTIDHQ